MAKGLVVGKYLAFVLFLGFSIVQAMQGGEATPTLPTQPPREMTSDEKNKLIDDLEALLRYQLDRKEVLQGTLNLSQNLSSKSDQEKTAILLKISEMAFLKSLSLENNQLTSVPKELKNLSNLKLLYLGGNQLTSVPKELGNLANLQHLGLSSNQLTSVPKELKNLSNIQFLRLGGNQLTSVPKELGNLANLQYLDLYSNKLTSVPKELGNLTNLQSLGLHSNELTSVPKELGNLTNLRALYLDGNQLTSVPSTLGNILTLTILGMGDNPYLLERGETPDQWGRQDLIDQFGNRGTGLTQQKSQEAMPPDTTFEEVYEALEKQPFRINRQTFVANRLPDLKVDHVFTGEEMLLTLEEILKSINLVDPSQQAYMTYETLAGDFASDARHSRLNNKDKVWMYLAPRLTGYIRTLYDIPLMPRDVGGWKMYEEQISQTKLALTYIFDQIHKQQDLDTKTLLFYQLVNGLLHCPTGQSEGINAVAFAIAEGTNVTANFQSAVRNILALKKESWYITAILVKGVDNEQNVHLISYYRDQLKKELGLSSAIGYVEKIGRIGFDPFSKNPANVLRIYYDLVTPERMVDWIMDKFESTSDRELKQIQRGLEGIITSTELTNQQKGDRTKLLPYKVTIDQWFALPNQDTLEAVNLENQLARALNISPDEFRKMSKEEKDERVSQLKQRIALYERQVPPQQSPIDGKFWGNFVIAQGLVKPEPVMEKQTINDRQVNIHIADKPLPTDWWTPWFTKNPLREGQVYFTPDIWENGNLIEAGGWRKLIGYVKDKIREYKQFRPLTVGDTLDYLNGARLINTEQPNWWQDYFTANPMTDPMATLTRDGIKRILIHMGFLIYQPPTPAQQPQQ